MSSRESYEVINYSLRPSKHMERKMLSESFKRLSCFGEMSSWRYVGFGGMYFADFTLFHRELGIREMVNIEKAAHHQQRHEFNAPFGYIRHVFKHSNIALPELSWTPRTILWLDYDGCLDKTVLSDITCFCANAERGSVLIVSVNAERPQLSERADQTALPGADEDELAVADETPPAETKLGILEQNIGKASVPFGTKEEDLSANSTSKVYYKIIRNHIDAEINKRSAPMRAGMKFIFRQLYHFFYNDGARMLTVGGVICDEGQVNLLGSHGIFDLDFIEEGPERLDISVPMLTQVELRYLKSVMPFPADLEKMDKKGIREKDIKKFQEVYRYFPNFAEFLS